VDDNLVGEAAEALHRRFRRRPWCREHHDARISSRFGRRPDPFLRQAGVSGVGGMAQTPTDVLAMLEPGLAYCGTDRACANDRDLHGVVSSLGHVARSPLAYQGRIVPYTGGRRTHSSRSRASLGIGNRAARPLTSPAPLPKNGDTIG